MDEKAPLLFWPSRLDDTQKGCQLLADILYRVVSRYWGVNLQLVFVANGEFQRHFRDIVAQHNFHQRVAICDFDVKLEHRAYGAADFLLDLAGAGGRDLKDSPIIAVFPEGNRTADVAKAVGLVAMGVTTYFWPFLPVSGSPNTVKALSEFCLDTFGSKLNVVTRKMTALVKAEAMVKELEGGAPIDMGGKAWR